MRKFKQILAILLTAAMAGAILAGCGDTGAAAEAPAAAEAVEEAAEAVKEAAAPVKKAAAKPAAKTAAKKAAPAKAAKAAETSYSVSLQYQDKEWNVKGLVQSAQDVWVYDMGRKAEDFKDVELYVKPEDSRVYFVVNGESGSFAI